MWQSPKTDWEIKPYVNGLYQGDWFNVEDYNRIVENIRVLHAIGQLICETTFSISSMTAATANAFPKAADINVLEQNLVTIMENTYDVPDYPGATTWVGNGATPTVDDLNRLEGACVEIYAHFMTLATYDLFIPLGADSLLTSTGDTFNVLV